MPGPGGGGGTDRNGDNASGFQKSFTVVISPLFQTLHDSFFPDEAALEITKQSTSGSCSMVRVVIALVLIRIHAGKNEGGMRNN